MRHLHGGPVRSLAAGESIPGRSRIDPEAGEAPIASRKVYVVEGRAALARFQRRETYM